MRASFWAVLLIPLHLVAMGWRGEPPFLFAQDWVNRPSRSVSIALEDAQNLDPIEAISSRYVAFLEPVFIDTADGKTIDATRASVSYAANVALLHSAQTYRAVHVKEGVYRLDLANFSGHNEIVLKSLLDTWERQQDTFYYLPSDDWKNVNTPHSYVHTDGKRYSAVRIRVVIPAAHVDYDGQLSSLILLTSSPVPIISAGQFFRYALNSDFGGLYPDFRRFNIDPQGKTFEEVFLARAGVDLKDLGQKNSDQRVALLRKPTGNVGIIEYLPAAVTRPSVGPTICTITRDYFSGNEINQDNHPFENLLERSHDGSEIFLPCSSGGLEFALSDSDGGFVRSAPLNPPNSLAADRTIPAPFLPILQGPSGCIRCHVLSNPDTARFSIYQDAPNWINWLRNVEVDGQRFDVFGESGGDDKLDRLASVFEGEASEAFGYAGRTYAKFVFQASGLPVEQATAAMMKVHDDWIFSYKEPKDVLLTLGVRIGNNEESVVKFNDLVKPAPEPLRIAQIRAWTKDQPVRMTVDDLLAIYPEMALRAMKSSKSDGVEVYDY